MSSTTESTGSLAIATRIHLGKASTPPEQSKLNQSVTSFLTFCNQVQHAKKDEMNVHAAIAVDAEEKIKGYNLAQAIERAIEYAQQQQNDKCVQIDVVEVSPWGNFIPALNALVTWASKTNVGSVAQDESSLILFISAETQLTSSSVDTLCSHMDASTLVAGAKLQGHDHKSPEEASEGVMVELSGRTTPWNTAAVWNLKKLGLTGFPLVAEGLIPNEDGSPGVSGVEETSCIAILQSILPPNTAKAKLIQLADSEVSWDQTWEDEERRKWHEQKMQSKLTRAARHLNLLGVSGKVIHFG